MDEDLLGTAFERLSAPARIDALVALQQHRARLDAAEARLFAAIDRAADGDDKRWVEEEICAALRVAPVTAAERLHTGRTLVDRLPATLDLLDAGVITARHARYLVDGIRGLGDGPATQVETRVLGKAGGQTPAAFGRSVRRAVLAVDPRDTEQKHQQDRQDRRVIMTPGPNGMGELWAFLPADDLATIMTALNAIAAIRLPDDDRTVPQRRADALTALAAQKLDDPGLPTWQGRRPSVQVTVAAATLLGLDDEPGDLDGYGPIPAALARALAFDPTGTWRRLLTDPAGTLVDASHTYRPPTDLADHIRARDRRCRFPGCTRPARRTDLDHLIDWLHGGPTRPDNLHCLCSRHHHLKHDTGWTVTGNPNGTLTWTSPTGHTYLSPPDPYD